MKNENGFGSIVCLDKSGKKRRKPWAVRITTGWKDGKQVRRYLGYYESQAEALMALAEYHKNGINLDVSNLTLNEVFDKWLERTLKKGISASLTRTYKMVKNKLDDVGNKPIKDIKTVHLQYWMDGIDLKPRTKKLIRSTMVQVYKYAMTNDMIGKNYAEGVEVTEKAEAVGAIFTDEEIKLLWKNKDDVTVQRILILIYSGMRVNELLKLKREDIHLDEYYAIGGSKTEAGKDRVIPFHNAILPFIEEQLGDNKYVVQGRGRTGEMAYSTILYQFNEVMEKLGMNHKIHDTRKTAVSIMHGSGIQMEIIRMIVGHSGKGVTEQVYLHKTPKELVEAVNTIEIKGYK